MISITTMAMEAELFAVKGSKAQKCSFPQHGLVCQHNVQHYLPRDTAPQHTGGSSYEEFDEFDLEERVQ